MAINPGINLSLKAVRQKKLEDNIGKSLIKKINTGLSHIERILTIELRDAVRQAVQESPEYISLTTATLRGEFGLENASNKVDTIIDVFVNSFRSELKFARSSGSTFYANLSIYIKIDFERLANHPEGFQEGTNQKGKNEALLPWLRWILLEGTNALVFDYSIKRGEGVGRSGLQFLMEATPGTNYEISKTQFTGVEDSNFLTRAINKNRKKIEGLIRKRSSELLRKSFSS